MKKLDFLKMGFEKRLYQKKVWLLSIAAILLPSSENTMRLARLPYTIRREDGEVFFIDPDTSEKVVIEDADYHAPLFAKHEKINIDNTWYHGIEGTITTTFGIYLLNRVVFWEAVKELAPYMNHLIEAKHVSGLISKLMVDNPLPGESIPEGKASVDQCLRISTQANYLEGFNEIWVKSGSVQALTVSKEVIALRERLFKEKADQLHDPVVAADVIKQVVDADYEEQMKGDSADFFIDKKFIDNARKKMFLVFGLERDFETGEFRLIKSPLNEGWDKEHITHLINTAVSASYDRGKSTGEGGADVNDLIRLTSRMRVAEPDCCSVVGEEIVLTESTFKGWVGSYYLEGGKPKPILSSSTNLIGRPINMRVPQHCQTKDGDFCVTCCGNALGGNENGLSAEVTNIATVFMLIKMKNAHVSKVDTVRLRLEDLLE